MKKTIKIFGSGCPSREMLFARTKQAIAELNLDADLDYIKDFSQMAQMGIMHTPALVIDDKIILSGKLATVEEIKELIK